MAFPRYADRDWVANKLRDVVDHDDVLNFAHPHDPLHPYVRVHQCDDSTLTVSMLHTGTVKDGLTFDDAVDALCALLFPSQYADR